MNTYTDTIAEWYADAEKVTKTNLPNKGDTLIYPRYGGDGYSIETNPDEWTPSIVGNHETVRILARAPKPKPAWHDAVAVTADVGRIDGARRVFVKDENGVWIDALTGHGCTAGHLRDVTPLIEAKVTDGTVDRVLDVLHAWNGTYPAGLGTKLAAAALGIEAE